MLHIRCIERIDWKILVTSVNSRRWPMNVCFRKCAWYPYHEIKRGTPLSLALLCQLMACRLFGTKSLSEAMLDFCWLEPKSKPESKLSQNTLKITECNLIKPQLFRPLGRWTISFDLFIGCNANAIHSVTYWLQCSVVEYFCIKDLVYVIAIGININDLVAVATAR